MSEQFEADAALATSDPAGEAVSDEQPQRPALPEALTATRLVVAIPARPTDEDSRTRVLIALEILAQKGLTSIALHQSNVGWLDGLRTQYAGRLTFGVHGPLTVDELRPVLDAEPAFVLANGPDPALGELGDQVGVVVLPTGLSPNELLDLHSRGGAGVQVFPADVMGGAYGASLRWVNPDLVLVPRGGLGAWSVGRWFEAGAACCVVDEALLGDALDEGGNVGQLRERAASFKDTVPH